MNLRRKIVCGFAFFVISASSLLLAEAGSPLLDAVRSADLARVRQLLSGGADPDAAEADGTTALHRAVELDDVRLIDALLDTGARPDRLNRYGVTPIQLAAVNGSTQAISRLLDAGADPNAVLPEGETVLMTAARTGEAGAVRLLLDAGADLTARETWYGETALIWASAENHPETVQLLLDRGAGANTRSGMQEFAQRRSGQSVLSLGSWTPLMYAARENAIEAGSVLVAGGADPDLVDPDGTTALVIAIINAHYDFAAMLVEAGADPNVVDIEARMGPLYAAVDMHRLAVGHGRPNPRPVGVLDSVDIARMLLDAGADPNARLAQSIMQRHHTAGDGSLGEGSTPFLRAAKSGDVAMMRVLLEGGADPAITLPNGVDALMFASGLGWRNGSPAAPSYDQGSEEEAVEAIRLLLELGLDLQAVNESGETPLHAAVSGRASEAIVRFLLEQGADPEAANGRNQTPLSLAESRGTETMAALLREAAARR